MEAGGDGEEVNPFSFKSFVESKEVEPPSYASSIDKKEKQRTRNKSKSRKKETFDDEVPFPDVDNQNFIDSSESPNVLVSTEENSANGGGNKESSNNPFSFKNFVSKEKDVASKKKRVLQIIGDEVHEVKPMSPHRGQDNGNSSQYVFGFTPPGSDGSDSEDELEDRHNSANNLSPDSGSVHYVVAPAGSSHSQLMFIEELNQLREDNKRLHTEVEDLTRSRDSERKKGLALQKKLTMIEKRESDETAALENMVHLVEQNLELTTKRALKSEALVSKLKDELKSYKTESVPMDTYQQLLDTHHSTLNAIKAKSRSASDEMIMAARRAEQALRDLYSGVDTLKVVSSELNYIDRITEIVPPKDNS